MENEKENGYGAGEGKGPDYHTDNREPVIVAEQPAREVTAGDVRQTSGGQDEADLGEPGQSGPERGTAGWGTAGQNSAAQDGSDGWSSPMDALPREDRWSDTGDKPYLGSPWEPTQSGPEYAPGKNNGASANDSRPGAANTRPSIRPNTSLTRLCTRKRIIWQRQLWSWGFFLCAVSAAVCCSALCSAYSASYLPLCQKKETKWTVRQGPD